MKTAALFAMATFLVASGILLMSCKSSHPHGSSAKPADIGAELKAFTATNAHAGHCRLRVAVNHFQGATTGFWGAENRTPTTVVGAVELDVNGVRVQLPDSAFRDLSQVQYSTQVGFFDDRSPSFFIRGGDAGFAYTARFEVQGGRLRKRTVTLDESDVSEELRF